MIPPGNITIDIVSSPSHGTVTINGAVMTYTPDEGYNGPDNYTYQLSVDDVQIGMRNVCLNVIYASGPKAVRPISPYCIVEEGINTGYQGWQTLEEYDTFSGEPTGNTRPNVPSDPDYVAPVWNPTDCNPGVLIRITNEDTDVNDPSRLFVDVDIIIQVNGAHLATIIDSETREFTVSVGDTVRVFQNTNPVNNPWPPNSESSMSVVKSQATLYSHSETEQTEPQGDFTFTASQGVYEINSLGLSTETGMRKYRLHSVISDAGVDEIVGLIYRITDETSSQEVTIKSALRDYTSEFNVMDDAGNCQITVNNASGNTYDVTLTNQSSSFSYTAQVGSGFDHVFTVVPKGDYIIIAEEA